MAVSVATEQDLIDLDAGVTATLTAQDVKIAETRSEVSRLAGVVAAMPAGGTTVDLGPLNASLDDLKSRVTKLELASNPSTGFQVYDPRVQVEKLGTNDTERSAKLVSIMNSIGPTSSFPELQMPIRRFRLDRRLPTDTGARLLGTITPAREFNTGAVIDYVGPGPSMFELKTEGGYSYPGGGVSRDFHAWGIQFNGPTDKDFLPAPPSTAFSGAHVQWYWDFMHCGWVGWDGIANGWGTGLNVGGLTHMQAYDNSTWLGGSECDWFGEGSLIDSGNLTNDLPAIDWSCSKSTLKSVMMSARKNSYQLKVSGGHNSSAVGVKFDSPDSEPILGHNVRFKGSAIDFGIANGSFKGGRGIRCESGSTEVTVAGNGFHGTHGDSVAICDPGFTGILIWEPNRYGNAKRVIKVDRLEQVYCSDPRITVVSTRDGSVLQQPKVTR